MADYALGRRVEHDPRSRQFAVSVAPAPAAPTVRWRKYGPTLDQGSVGACTGFAMAQWLNCKPAHDPREPYLTNDHALGIYMRATDLDPWPGSYPPNDTGSSGLAACKAAKEQEFISGYRWIFQGVDQLKSALQTSPVLAGTNWYAGMFQATPVNGAARFLSLTGSVAGGHEYVVVGWNQRSRFFTILNSWGQWGLGGFARIWETDMQRLLDEQGDLVVPVV